MILIMFFFIRIKKSRGMFGGCRDSGLQVSFGIYVEIKCVYIIHIYIY